eukprot:TRINITY_DN10427_c0_g1_i1.p1 TRINITY_DN10427_c0_g1~~TRINITY_DN10427_c0_g1_i1.p1  ORF type:complete len:446 (+),score=78.40 TRINITY_DN10427_c0_g1_i1:54-1391(+)
MYHTPTVPALPKPQKRCKSKGRRVLLESLQGVVPRVPVGGDLGMNDGDGEVFQVCDAFRTLSPYHAMQVAEWETAESVKIIMKQTDDTQPLLKDRVGTKYVEWLLSREAAYEALTPTNRDNVDLCQDMLYAVDSYARRVGVTTQNMYIPSRTALESPESTKLCDELQLAVACAIYDRCAADLGRYSSVFLSIRSVIFNALYTTLPSDKWHSITSHTEQYLNQLPYFKNSQLVTWENNAVVEELQRAKKHMYLWSWSIWRKVVLGRRRYCRILSQTDTMLERRTTRNILQLTLKAWRHVIYASREERYYEDMHNLIPNVSWIPVFGSFEDKLRAMADKIGEQEREITISANKLQKSEELTTKLSMDVIAAQKKSRAHNTRALAAVQRHTMAVDEITMLQARIKEMQDTEQSLRDEIEQLKENSSSEGDMFSHIGVFETKAAEFVAK